MEQNKRKESFYSACFVVEVSHLRCHHATKGPIAKDLKICIDAINEGNNTKNAIEKY